MVTELTVEIWVKDRPNRSSFRRLPFLARGSPTTLQAISRYGLAPRSRRLHLVTKMGGPRGWEGMELSIHRIHGAGIYMLTIANTCGILMANVAIYINIHIAYMDPSWGIGHRFSHWKSKPTDTTIGLDEAGSWDLKIGIWCWKKMVQAHIVDSPSGYDIHSSPWLSHGPNRNRWFTYKQWWFSMAMLNNQMVELLNIYITPPKLNKPVAVVRCNP